MGHNQKTPEHGQNKLKTTELSRPKRMTTVRFSLPIDPSTFFSNRSYFINRYIDFIWRRTN